MQSREGYNSELVFVVEVCQDCKSHGWNTRHDEAKYQEFYNRGKWCCQHVFISLRRKGAPRWPSRQLPAANISFVCSVECDCWTRSKLNHHEKPDSQVIPATWLIQQPDPQWGWQSTLLPISAQNWLIWGLVQWNGKTTTTLPLLLLIFILFIYSWSFPNYKAVTGQMSN